MQYDDGYKDKLKELENRKLAEEYTRVKDILYKGYRYGLWDIPEKTLFAMIADIEQELAARKTDNQ